jgi:hypothetical protein
MDSVRNAVYGEVHSTPAKCTGKVYGKSVWKKCTGKVYGKSVWEECTGKVYGKSVTREGYEKCTGKVYWKSVQEKCTGKVYGRSVQEKSTEKCTEKMCRKNVRLCLIPPPRPHGVPQRQTEERSIHVTVFNDFVVLYKHESCRRLSKETGVGADLCLFFF